MAQSSMFWPTGAGQPGDNSTIDDARWQRLWKALYNDDNLDESVVRGYENAYNCTVAGVRSVSLNTGAGFAQGVWYWSDAAITFDAQLTTPVEHRVPNLGSETRHRIVARWDDAGNTVRVRLLTNSAGITTDPALVRTSTTWDYPLWSLLVTTGGTVTLTDQRAYLFAKQLPDESVDTAQLAAEAVTIAKVHADILRRATPGTGANAIWTGTKTAYDALTNPSTSTLYFQTET